MAEKRTQQQQKLKFNAKHSLTLGQDHYLKSSVRSGHVSKKKKAGGGFDGEICRNPRDRREVNIWRQQCRSNERGQLSINHRVVLIFLQSDGGREKDGDLTPIRIISL